MIFLINQTKLPSTLSHLKAYFEEAQIKIKDSPKQYKISINMELQKFISTKWTHFAIQSNCKTFFLKYFLSLKYDPF